MRELKIPMVVAPIDGADYAVLTTNHSCSSYGQPVLVYREMPYGPADYVPRPWGNERAADIVRVHLERRGVELGEEWFEALPKAWLRFAAWPADEGLLDRRPRA